MDNDVPFMVLDRPFTEIYAEFDAKEQQHIHYLFSVLGDYRAIPNPNQRERRQINALLWVLEELKHIERIEDASQDLQAL